MSYFRAMPALVAMGEDMRPIFRRLLAALALVLAMIATPALAQPVPECSNSSYLLRFDPTLEGAHQCVTVADVPRYRHRPGDAQQHHYRSRQRAP